MLKWPVDSDDSDVTREQRCDWRTRKWLLALAAVSVAFIVYGSWIPFKPRPATIADVWPEYVRSQSWPWNGRGRVDFGVNVMLFMPLSFALTGALGATLRRPLIAALLGLVTLVFCTLLSVSIELGQGWMEGRVSSISDSGAQVLGAATGILGWMALGRLVLRRANGLRESWSPASRLDFWLQAYLLVLVGMSLFPLDVTIHPGDLLDKYQAGRISLLQAFQEPITTDRLFEWGVDLALFVPVGVLGLSWGIPRGSPRRSILGATLVGTCFVAGLEIAQLFVYSRFTELSDVVIGAIGVLVGAVGGRICLPEHGPNSGYTVDRVYWAALALAYAALPAACMWWPFEFTTDAELVRERLANCWRMPFASIVRASPLTGFTLLTERVLLYLPLGFLFGRILLGKSRTLVFAAGYYGIVLLALALFATVVEAGQVLVPSRYPDPTDVLLACIGGTAGAMLARSVVRGHPSGTHVAAA